MLDQGPATFLSMKGGLQMVRFFHFRFLKSTLGPHQIFYGKYYFDHRPFLNQGIIYFFKMTGKMRFQ